MVKKEKSKEILVKIDYFGVKKLKIKEFIQGRNVSYDTVRRYIVNHPEKFKGHIGRPNNIILDDVAVQLLDNKYPFPSPVQVIEDSSVRSELSDLKDKMLSLSEKYSAVMEEKESLLKENANLKLMQHKQFLLEEDNNRLQRNIEDKKERIDWQDRMIKAQNRKLQELLEEKKTWSSTFEDRERDIIKLEQIVSEERKEIEHLKGQLHAEKNKTWWDKLRGR